MTAGDAASPAVSQPLQGPPAQARTRDPVQLLSCEHDIQPAVAGGAVHGLGPSLVSCEHHRQGRRASDSISRQSAGILPAPSSCRQRMLQIG